MNLNTISFSPWQARPTRLLYSLTFSQIWLIPLVDDRQSTILDKIEKKSPGRRCVLVVVGLAYRSSETLVCGSAVRSVGPFCDDG